MGNGHFVSPIDGQKDSWGTLPLVYAGSCRILCFALPAGITSALNSKGSFHPSSRWL